MQVPSFRFPNDATDVAAIQALADAAASDRIVLGPETLAFETEFARYCQVPHCIGVANGSDALELALRALGVGLGDTVALAANAGFYGSIAVRSVGALPQYLDVEDASLTLSPSAFAQALAHGTRQPKCIIVTHLYGQLAAIEAIVAIAREHGIAVVEDCAQAHGAKRGGKRAGSFGDVACFSFYPTKNLGATGDGGALVASSDALATRIRCLRTYGWSAKYHVDLPGGRNSRLDEIQAAALRVRLRTLDERNAARRAIAADYNAAFAGLGLTLPVSAAADYVGHLYVVRHTARDAIRADLQQRGVATDIHYPVADHQQKAYVVTADLPVTERACREVFSLPCFPGLTQHEVDHVIGSVRDAVAACTR